MIVSKRKGGSHTFTSPRVRSDPLHLLGSGVTGDWSDGVPDELASGDVQTESHSVVFVTGLAKSSDGVPLFPALPSNRIPQMGTLWARQRRAFEPLSLYRAARAPEPC